MPKTDALSGLPRPAYGDKRSHRALVTLAGAAISRDKPVELADHVSASPYEDPAPAVQPKQWPATAMGLFFQFCRIEFPQEARLLLSRVDSEKPSEQNIAHFGPICRARRGYAQALRIPRRDSAKAAPDYR